MTQSGAEVLILAVNALGAGILMFVACVAQKMASVAEDVPTGLTGLKACGVTFEEYDIAASPSARASPVQTSTVSVW